MGIDPYVPWGSGEEPGQGPRLAVKDVVDIAGQPTGAGHPRWLETHDTADSDAEALARLRAAGATITGKTHCDELAYSLGGTNAHYGSCDNPAAPGRTCGGSSSGAAAAVASGSADLGLGTDTAGSIRVPASFTGLYGYRPTRTRTPREGIVPLAPEFDVPGLLARDLPALHWGAQALLGGWANVPAPRRAHVPADIWGELSPRVGAALAPSIAALGLPVDRSPVGHDVTDAFAIVQAAQVWSVHGDWVTRERPEFGPGVGARISRARALTTEEVTLAAKALGEAAERLREMFADGAGVIVLPSAPGVAPRRTGPLERAAPASRRQATSRAATLRLTCLASLAGAPALSVPGALLDGTPIGLCLVAAPGADEALFELAAKPAGGLA